MTGQVVDRRAFYELVRESEDYEQFSARRDVWLEEMKSRPWYREVENRLDELPSLEYLISMDSRLYEFFEINDVNGSLVAPPELENLDMPVLAIYGSEDAPGYLTTMGDWLGEGR